MWVSSWAGLRGDLERVVLKVRGTTFERNKNKLQLKQIFVQSQIELNELSYLYYPYVNDLVIQTNYDSKCLLSIKAQSKPEMCYLFCLPVIRMHIKFLIIYNDKF